MQDKKQYKQDIQWTSSSKLCRMSLKKDKNGSPYFIGEFNKMFKVKMTKDTFPNSKPDDYTLFLIPIKYVEDNTEGSLDPVGVFSQSPQSNEEIPF